MRSIKEAQRETKILHEAEVIVVGGGPGGIGAALGSARTGADTVLIDRFGGLGGIQSHGCNPTFSLIDPELHGGVLMEIIGRLKEDGALMDHEKLPGPKSHIKAGIIAALGAQNLPKRLVETDVGYWGPWSTGFDGEYYKYLLDVMMQESKVKLLYHMMAVDTIREGNLLKGVIVQGKEGRRAILGKVVIDTTGDGYIAWQCGAPVQGDEGYPAGKKKGRPSGMLDSFFIGGVDLARYRKFKAENPAEWGQMHVGREIIKKAKANGAYIRGESVVLAETFDIFQRGRVYVMNPIHPVAEGNTVFMTEEMTACEIDMRRQTWDVFKTIKANVPGFENSYVEKTPTIPCVGNQHRLIGDYQVTIGDMRAGKAHEDSIAINNMPPDIYEAVGIFDYDYLPHDIPLRSLVSREVENLLAAGGTISCGGFAQGSLKYCAPTMCTGQAAGTAAALAVKNNTTPKKLDAKFVQDELRKKGIHPTIKDLSKEVLEPYKTIQAVKIRFQRQDIDEPFATQEEVDAN